MLSGVPVACMLTRAALAFHELQDGTSRDHRRGQSTPSR